MMVRLCRHRLVQNEREGAKDDDRPREEETRRGGAWRACVFGKENVGQNGIAEYSVLPCVMLRVGLRARLFACLVGSLWLNTSV
jgi:hypothetical protein